MRSIFSYKLWKTRTGTPGAALPYEWIGLAEQGVWLVVALALYRHQCLSEVLDRLDPALPDAQASFVSRSAAAPCHAPE